MKTNSAVDAARRAGLRTWIELDARAARRNYRVFRKLIGGRVKLWAVVKSNAYGHGLFAYSPLAARLGVDGFCVDSIVEATALRRTGLHQPILVLGHSLPARLREAARGKISVTVSSFEAMAELKLGAAVPRFHIKLDTGMRRQGFFPHEVPRLLALLAAERRLAAKLEGIYTHFAAANDARDRSVTEAQFEQFQAACRQFAQAGYRQLSRHAAATGGTLLDRRYHLDAVRVGIGLYGLWPSRELERQFGTSLRLDPVLAWRAVVGEVKQLEAGDRVGYDLTEQISRRMRMAVLPIGYWHGYPRALSGVGEALMRGRRARALGRVSMDVTVVAPAESVLPGDVATLIGRDRSEAISAAAAAEQAGTNAYELLTRLNPLMERIVVRAGTTFPGR